MLGQLGRLSRRAQGPGPGVPAARGRRRRQSSSSSGFFEDTKQVGAPGRLSSGPRSRPMVPCGRSSGAPPSLSERPDRRRGKNSPYPALPGDRAIPAGRTAGDRALAIVFLSPSLPGAACSSAARAPASPRRTCEQARLEAEKAVLADPDDAAGLHRPGPVLSTPGRNTTRPSTPLLKAMNAKSLARGSKAEAHTLAGADPEEPQELARDRRQGVRPGRRDFRQLRARAFPARSGPPGPRIRRPRPPRNSPRL